jgi:hypothetical protein
MSGLAGLGLLAKLGGAKATLAKVPPKVWYGLAIVAAVVGSFFVHQHYAHKALKAADASGYNRARQEDAKVIAQMRVRAEAAEANAKAISQDTRNRNDETNRRIASSADALLVRGPGAASCRRVSNPTVSASSSQPRASSGAGDAAASPMSSDDGTAAVPWVWLVNSSREADLNRAEVLSWRDWYQRQSAEWAKLRSKP